MICSYPLVPHWLFCTFMCYSCYTVNIYRLKVRKYYVLCFCARGWEKKMKSRNDRMAILCMTIHQLSWCGVGDGGTVKRNQEIEEGGGGRGGGGGGRGLDGGLGVTLMECHSTFEWWEADNQSDAAPEFKGSRASTLSAAINNAIQYLITANCRNNVTQALKKKKKINWWKQWELIWWFIGGTTTMLETKASTYVLLLK